MHASLLEGQFFLRLKLFPLLTHMTLSTPPSLVASEIPPSSLNSKCGSSDLKKEPFLLGVKICYYPTRPLYTSCHSPMLKCGFLHRFQQSQVLWAVFTYNLVFSAFYYLLVLLKIYGLFCFVVFLNFLSVALHRSQEKDGKIWKLLLCSYWNMKSSFGNYQE